MDTKYIELQHRQVTPQRNVKGPQFTGGIIDINWSVGSTYGWIPHMSYFRIGLKITKDGANANDRIPPTLANKVGFADNPCANLFNNCYFKAGGQDVSSITNYLSQADQVKQRMTKSGAWLDNVGEQAYGMDADLVARYTRASKKSDVYFLWQPPIGIMDCEQMLGAGDYRIQLNPNSFYKTAVVEVDDITAVPVGLDVEVTTLEFYAAIARQPSPMGDMSLILNEHQVQSKTISAGENNLDFTVPTSTKYISVFAQSQKAGTVVSLPLTSFRTIDPTSNAKGSEEQTLQSIQLSYANTVKPTTRWTSSLDGATGTDQLQQRYVDSKMASRLLFSDGGAEPYDDWLARGVLLCYDFNRDADSRDSQLQVQVSFGALPADVNLFIIAHYTRIAKISGERGFITSVQTQTV